MVESRSLSSFISVVLMKRINMSEEDIIVEVPDNSISGMVCVTRREETHEARETVGWRFC